MDLADVADEKSKEVMTAAGKAMIRDGLLKAAEFNHSIDASGRIVTISLNREGIKTFAEVIQELPGAFAYDEIKKMLKRIILEEISSEL